LGKISFTLERSLLQFANASNICLKIIVQTVLLALQSTSGIVDSALERNLNLLFEKAIFEKFSPKHRCRDLTSDKRMRLPAVTARISA